MSEQIIVIGGGLRLSAAHVLEHGGRAALDKCLPGRHHQGQSDINGAPTRTQAAKGINDNADKFEADIIRGAAGVSHTRGPRAHRPVAKVRLQPANLEASEREIFRKRAASLFPPRRDLRSRRR